MVASDRSKAVTVALFLLSVNWVGVSCLISYSRVSNLYVSFSELIISVGEERAFFLLSFTFNKAKKYVCFRLPDLPLFFPSDPKVFCWHSQKKKKLYHTQPTLFATIFYWFCYFRCHI